jgi:Family of unknown function (DUF5906)
MQEFNTIQYCIDNLIPCFTFPMDASKKAAIKWGEINRENFKQHLSDLHNGFTIITGHSHVVIDFDEKHHPPEEIKQALMDACTAVEKTPGGFHFWFALDARTERFDSGANIPWNGVSITGLDRRGKKGICYTAPSHYYIGDALKQYRWIKGNLSTATVMPDPLFHHLTANDSPEFQLDTATIETFRENGKVTLKITPKTCRCLVKEDYLHSSVGHSCIFLSKLKTCYSGVANCFSHGKRKLGKEACDAMVEQFWPVEESNETLDEYSSMKRTFEESNFKVLDPIGFYSNIANKWVFRDRSQLKIAYENMFLMDETSFIDKWLKDPNMKTHSRVSFEASSDPSVFVMPESPPPQFVYPSYTCPPHLAALPIFDGLMDILTNHQEPIKQYMLNWMAHMVQKPLELPGVAIILNGQKGAGKDTLGDFLGEFVIGLKHYQNYSNQSQYFDKHDESKANKFLVKVEEINKKMLEEGVNADLFKASLTSPILNFNPKNKQPYNLKNGMRVLATSNHSNPVDVSQKERRYVISVVSPEKIGDAEYWCKIRSELFHPGGGLAVAQMLLGRDLTQFNPRVLPENTYLKQLQEESVDSVQQCMDHIKAGEYAASELYTMYRDYCGEEGMPMYGPRKFSTQLMFLIANGSITRQIERTRTNKSIKYSIQGGVVSVA